LTWEVNLGSDTSPKGGAVSSTPQTPANRWIVSRDSAGQDAISPRPLRNKRQRITANQHRPFWCPNGDLLTDQYHVTLGANSNRAPDDVRRNTTIAGGTNAPTAAAIFDNYTDMPMRLFVGLARIISPR